MAPRQLHEVLRPENLLRLGYSLKELRG